MTSITFKNFSRIPRLTLIGHSFQFLELTGGGSCHYHLLNKNRIDFFERAVICSGVINNNDTWAYETREGQQKRVNLALEKLNCPPDLTLEETLTYLMSLDASKFSEAMDVGTFTELIRNFPCPVSTFCENEGDPLVPLVQKPLLVGVTAEEGNLFPEVIAAGFDPVTGLTPEVTFL